MIDAIIGLAVLAVGLFAAFFAGGKRQKKYDEIERENLRKIREKDIQHAIDFADDVDWSDSLRKRNK